MTRSVPTLAAVALLSAAIAATPAAAATGLSPARDFAPRQVVLKLKGAAQARTVELPAGTSVHKAALALRRNPRVAYATPNYIATASVTSLPGSGVANDPGSLIKPPGPPGGWVSLQWNLLPWKGPRTKSLPVSPGGINAVGAWRRLIAAGHPGAAGITVAVLDTGVAYRNYRHNGAEFLRSPDFSAGQFTRGYDFVSNDPLPLDRNGHGTHVAGTIAEKTNNGIGLAGIAYGAKLMPVRVLDMHGEGLATRIARGVRFAVANGADVINMSFNFLCREPVPIVDAALRHAYEEGVVTVASIGNLGSEGCVSAPATSPHVIGVGGTTEGACLGRYSPAGDGVDVLAPGGGRAVGGCRSAFKRSIYQVTLKKESTKLFGEPGRYVGTSMAAAHVSAVAAMVLAAGIVPKTTPQGVVKAVTQRLEKTARSLGLPRTRQGAGLIDAGKATAPAP